MLKSIHEVVAKVCPIHGIADSGDGTYRIDFADEATVEQRAAAHQALQNPTPEPNWQAFRIGLEDDPAYLRVIASAPGRGILLNLAVERLHSLSGDSYLAGLAEVARLWNKIVNALQTPLTQEEINALNALGTTSNVPFALNTNGLLG